MDNIVENIQKRESVLIHTLGNNTFNNIRDFFQSIEYGDSDYNIYISKKCYALFLEFCPFLKLSDNKVRCTDVRIPVLLEEIKGKKVTIIDDILIHGRTLNSVKRKLIDLKCKIEICVIAVNEDVEKIKTKELNKEVEENLKELSKTAEETKHFYKCNQYLWRKISDLIMRSFWATNTSYSAYLPIVVLTKKGVEILDRKRREYNVKSCQNHSFDKMGMRIDYFFLKRFEQNVDDNSTILYFSAALQRNAVMDSYKLLPVLILHEGIHNNKEYFNQIFQRLYGNEKEEVLKLMQFEQFNRNDMITKMNIKFLIYSLSRLMLKIFLNDVGLKGNEYFFDDTNLEYSFGKPFLKFADNIGVNYEILESIQRKIKRQYERLCFDKIQFSNSQFFINLKNYNNKIFATKSSAGHDKISLLYALKESIDNWNQSKNKVKTDQSKEKLREYLIDAIYDAKKVYDNYEGYANEKISSYIFARFLKMNSMLDEAELLQNKKRLLGLKVTDMLKIVQKATGFSRGETLVGFFSQFYLGASTIIVDSEQGFYGLYCHAGEQSYKCIVHEFVPIVYFSYRYKRNFVSKVSEIMCECMLQLAVENYHYFNIPFEISDFKKYSNDASENIYDISTLQEHCKTDSSRILCRAGFMLEDYVSLTPDVEEMSVVELLQAFRKYILQCMESVSGNDRKYLIEAFGIAEK